MCTRTRRDPVTLMNIVLVLRIKVVLSERCIDTLKSPNAPINGSTWLQGTINTSKGGLGAATDLFFLATATHARDSCAIQHGSLGGEPSFGSTRAGGRHTIEGHPYTCVLTSIITYGLF